MKPNLNELNLRSRRNPCSEISKSRWWNLGKMTYLNSNYLSKSNQNCKDYEAIALQTRLKQRLSLKLLWLLRDSLIPSPSCFRRSRGDLQMFTHNDSWLTILNPRAIEFRMQKNHKELKIFHQKMINFFTFNQKLQFQKKKHQFIQEFIVKYPSHPFC